MLVRLRATHSQVTLGNSREHVGVCNVDIILTLVTRGVTMTKDRRTS